MMEFSRVQAVDLTTSIFSRALFSKALFSKALFSRSMFSRAMTLPAAMVFAIAATNVSAGYEDSIAERVAPVGEVCLQGEECAASLQVAAAGPRSGEDVYNSACLACHASGAAGAPKFRIAEDWYSRLAAGIDTVYANAINGIGAMPAKGLCGNCSDDEIKAAVDHMIEGL